MVHRDGLGLELGARLSPAEMVVTSCVSSKASSSTWVKPSESSERAGEEAEALEVMGFSNRLESVSALAHASRISLRVGAMRASF